MARLGARILLARNVFEAVEAVRTFHPNIVLSDISMPDCDGLAADANTNHWVMMAKIAESSRRYAGGLV